MANGNSNTEWMVKLQESLNDLKISTVSVVAKLDQLNENVAKLEKVMAEIIQITSSQETRISLLEARFNNCQERIPESLLEDLALMKSQLKSYQKFTWMLASGFLAVIVKLVMEMVQ
jgi:chromosome segregation ATPase